MLTLTDKAKAAIVGITTQAGLPPTGGIRICLAGTEDQVELSLSTEPAATDAILVEDGVRLFLDAEAAQVLARHTLDAAERPHGGIGFQLRET
ncbi:MAG TPA: hypothetical protein VK024_09500 [Actinomycetaceae bacterium]|nr:hypothetical protein [Actinomycetaceae bacterium]